MPELPEIESLRRRLSPLVLHSEIAGSRILQTYPLERNQRRALRALRGLSIERLRRRGKYLVFELSDESALILHFGMSGRLVHRRPGERHDRYALLLQSRGWLTFNDFRRFGRVWRVPIAELESSEPLGKL